LGGRVVAVYKVINQAGKYQDDRAIQDVVHYAMSKAYEDGVFGGAVLPEIAIPSMEGVTRAYHKEKGTRLRHSVLSFAPDEKLTPSRVRDVARQAILHYENDYQIIAAVHEDRDHLHVHFIMNTVSYRDGSKYGGHKKDYYDFLKRLNGIVHEYGTHVELEK